MVKNFGKLALVWLYGCIVWAVLLLWLSLIPHPPRLPWPLLSWDKFQHACAYALLTLLAGKSMEFLRLGRRGNWFLAGFGALIFGIVIEGLQYLGGKGRVADYRDVIANATGILAACLFAALWRRWSRPTKVLS